MKGFEMESPKSKRLFQEKRKRFVTRAWLLENYVSWSEPTLRRRIEVEGFPFLEDSGGKMFDLDVVDIWFKKRTGEAS